MSDSSQGVLTWPDITFNETADNVLGGLLVVFMVVGITGNISALLYFGRKKDDSIYDLLYTIISAVDLCTCAIIFPVILSLFNGRLPGVIFSNYTLCGLWAVAAGLLVPYSMFMVMIISVTRAVAIIFPFYKTKRPVIVGACVGYPALLLVIMGTFLVSGLVKSDYSHYGALCGTMSTGPFPNLNWSVYIIIHLMKFLLVSLVVLVSFLLSLQALLSSNSQRSKNNGRQFRRFSVTIAIFTSLFLVCNLPSFVVQMMANCIYWFNAHNFIIRSQVFLWYGILFAYPFLNTLNAALNPCLYFLRMSKFQKWVKNALQKFRACISRCVRGEVTKQGGG